MKFICAILYGIPRQPTIEATHINVKDMKSLKLMLNNLKHVFTTNEEPILGLHLKGVDLS